jgi:hypothetical protein
LFAVGSAPSSTIAPVFDISDGICAYLVGGLGNQLFIFAAALSQAKRLGCPLYVDASSFIHNNPPWNVTYELGDLIGDLATDVTATSPWRTTPLYSFHEQRQSAPEDPGTAVAEVEGQKLTVFSQLGYTYDPKLDTVAPGTTIVGLYQSPFCFTSAGAEMQTFLESIELSPREAEYVDAARADPRITAHARRGDYLSPQWKRIGSVNQGYFTRAAALCERLGSGSRLRFYSDSPEMMAEEITAIPGSEMAPPDDGLRTIAVMLAMGQGTGMIMSNSSFSFWAAWLISARRPGATVIAPRPWSRTGSPTDDRLLPDWLTIGADYQGSPLG